MAREAAEEVRRAHERFALVARATNDVVWDWDAVAGTIVWNDALKTMFGYDPEQIDNRLQWWDEHLHPDDRERVVTAINFAIHSGATSWSDEYRFERADGSFTEVLDRGYISRAPDGKPVRMIGAMLDVTERKRAERIAALMAEASAVLASSLDYRDTVARAARLAVPLLADLCIVDVAEGDGRWERLAFAPFDGGGEYPARRTRAVHPAPGDLIGDVMASGNSLLREEVSPGFADQLPWAPGDRESLGDMAIRSALIVPLCASPGIALGAMILLTTTSRRRFHDSDVRAAEDLARRAALTIEHARLFAEVQQANRTKDEFLATLSHELRTPLTAIVGWSRLLADPNLDPDTRRLGMETIHLSAAAQARLIDDVLDVSRVISGKMRLHVLPVVLEDIVRGSVEAVRLAANAKGIVLSVPSSRAGLVMGDPDRLQQVVWNLLTNAIKFTPPGGQVLAEVVTTPAGVTMSVTDSGQGIARDFLPHVFEPFRQADSGTTRMQGGLGLGLAIVHYIIEAHGGTVSAHSDGPGTGASFVITLPRLAASSATAGAEHADAVAEGAGKRLQGIRILFVDDHDDARHLALLILARDGAEVYAASSAAEGLAILEVNRVDVVISDIAMPVTDGYGLLRDLREADAAAQRHTPVIAATAFGGPEDRERFLAAGFDACLRKPMEPDELVEAVVAVLRRGET